MIHVLCVDKSRLEYQTDARYRRISPSVSGKANQVHEIFISDNGRTILCVGQGRSHVSICVDEAVRIEIVGVGPLGDSASQEIPQPKDMRLLRRPLDQGSYP